LPHRNSSVPIYFKAFLDKNGRRLSVSTELKLQNRDLEKVYHTFSDSNEIGKLNITSVVGTKIY
jgi:hypothetical protein